MLTRKQILPVALLLLALFALSGCGPRSGRADIATLDPNAVTVDLPAIYIDFDENGTPTVAGMTIDQLGAQFGQSLPAVPSIPAEQLALLINANIQHIQLNNSAEGLRILINGLQIPSLGWDGATLADTVELLNSFGVPLPSEFSGLLPMLGNVGTGVVVRFPLKEGASSLPLLAEGGMSMPAESKAAQEQFLATVGQAPVIQFSVNYNADGSWTVDGKSAADYMETVPGFKWDGLNMQPDRIRGLKELGVETFTIASNEKGLFISINGNALPHLTWGNGEIEHTLALAEQTGLLQQFGGNISNLDAMLAQFKSFLPIVQTSQFSMTINLPE